MQSTSLIEREQTTHHIHRAVHQNNPTHARTLQERLFAWLFSGLVYAQIWEDPLIDMEALNLKADDDMIAIASGGCNVLSYLSKDLHSITAIDLNKHHIKLNEMKKACFVHFPSHDFLFDFFAKTNHLPNAQHYKMFVEPYLSQNDQNYWREKSIFGEMRIQRFCKNLYHYGMLGHFISALHVFCRLYGVRLSDIIACQNIDQQRHFFATKLQPILRSRLFKAIVNYPAALYGLGIPPAQYRSLLRAGEDKGGMAYVLEQRVKNLVCEHSLSTNYFAWQAFAQRYPALPSQALPPYLNPQNFHHIKSQIDKLTIIQANLIDYLEHSPPHSLSCFILLDAQDWMNDETLNRLWRAIMLTARPGARVIFRTADQHSLLTHRLDPHILAQWDYDEHKCRALHQRDRSAIYGGFHLYSLRD
jgi:S-adenosylmethionine-diacylglycerol 3-amino-3-carboxypropyl transferase